MTREDLAPPRAFRRRVHVVRSLAGLALLILPAIASGQTNLAPNPSFETVSGGLAQNWTSCTNSGAATLTTATTPIDQGARSLKVTVTQAGDVGVCSDAMTVPSGVTFRLAARSDVNISTTQNKQARLQILELSSADALLASRVVATSVGRVSGWESVSGFFTTGPNTAKVKIRLLHDVPGSSGVSFYWDSVSLARDTAVAWEGWERELTSAADYSAGTNSNPYRDLRLQATFFRGTVCGTPPATCTLPGCFQQAGFWDGTQGSSSVKSFKVRTALPAGDWCWKTSCSTVAASGTTTPNCASDAGLTQSGALKVTAYGGANKLYRLGMPVPKAGGNFLVYGDGSTTFPWIADTAWSAPMSFSPPSLGSAPSGDLWKNYVADRTGKGFNVLLVAPASQYVNAPASRPAPPASGFTGFLAGTGCTPANYKVVPNECSYLDPAYWRKLDSMVRDANDAGIVVLVAGVIDPTDRGGPGTNLTPLQKYPGKSAAEAFARQLAARLAGSFVFFSPGFDDKVDEALEGGLTAQDSMTAVGQAIRGAAGSAPRHLVGNQLAGGAAFTDYDLFHAASWLSFELYQSGHKGNQGTPCSYASGQEYARAVCRARELTLRFRCQGAASTVQACPTTATGLPPGQKKPAVNSEGAYEDFSTVAEDPDTREGERATAYASALSGSFGYTIGVKGIYGWDNPAIYSNTYQQNKSQADEDLARLGGIFRGAPWTDLEPRHNLVSNNAAVNTAATNPITTNASPANEKKRMLLAGNSSYALIYVPGVDPTVSTGVQIKTANVSNALPGLNCTSAWSKAWVNPRTSGLADVTCVAGTGIITLKGQPGCPAGATSCDWILRLTKGTSASSASLNAIDPEVNSESSFNDLEVWTELSADSSTSAVMGQVIDPEGLPVDRPFVVSPDGASFQKLPKTARDGAGNFFITWEGESPATGLDEIFAQRYDNEGALLQDTFAVSAAAEGQQAEPSVTADRDDNFVVSWTRYPLADEPVVDPGSIKVQAFDANGDPAGAAIDLPSQSGGVPTMSLVQADGDGNLWVAWTEEDRENGGGDVYAQRLLQGGTPYGQPFKVNSTHDGVGRLVALQVESDGSFRLVWEGLDANGEDKGLRARPYDAGGNSTGAESAVSSLD
jgi:hypothetical protein